MQRLAAAVAMATLAGGAALTPTTAVAFVPRSGTPPRPAAEHVPASVSHVRIRFTDLSDASQDKTVILRGERAQHLVALFDALRREPRHSVQCEIASASDTTVAFHGPKHTWRATEAICRNITVTRDGIAEPTLLPSKAWDAALTRYLGHSPDAPSGGVTPVG